jgi:hypothetical protein
LAAGIPLAALVLSGCGLVLKLEADGVSCANGVCGPSCRETECTDAGLGLSDGGDASNDPMDGSLVGDGARPDGSGIPAITAHTCDARMESLVACYRFESSTQDESALGNHLTASGTAFVAGIDGKALQLKPASTVSAASTATLSPASLTVDLWLRATALPATGRVVLVDKHDQYSVSLQPDGTVVCSASVQQKVQTDVIALNTWAHVACTYDGSTLMAYHDGRSKGTVAMQGMVAIGTSRLHVGEDSPSGAEQYEGFVDTVRIWNRALDAHEVCTAAGVCEVTSNTAVR